MIADVSVVRANGVLRNSKHSGSLGEAVYISFIVSAAKVRWVKR